MKKLIPYAGHAKKHTWYWYIYYRTFFLFPDIGYGCMEKMKTWVYVMWFQYYEKGFRIRRP